MLPLPQDITTPGLRTQSLHTTLQQNRNTSSWSSPMHDNDNTVRIQYNDAVSWALTGY